MGMNIGSSGEDDVISTINTTPLVDVMLVLLIIFLITVPVVVQTAKVNLPEEAIQVRAAKPEDINLAVDALGRVFWNELYVREESDLLVRLKEASQTKPQPEVHIRGDQSTEYEHIARVILNVQRAGISKVGFITTPPGKN